MDGQTHRSALLKPKIPFAPLLRTNGNINAAWYKKLNSTPTNRAAVLLASITPPLLECEPYFLAGNGAFAPVEFNHHPIKAFY